MGPLVSGNQPHLTRPGNAVCAIDAIKNCFNPENNVDLDRAESLILSPSTALNPIPILVVT